MSFSEHLHPLAALSYWANVQSCRGLGWSWSWGFGTSEWAGQTGVLQNLWEDSVSLASVLTTNAGSFVHFCLTETAVKCWLNLLVQIITSQWFRWVSALSDNKDPDLKTVSCMEMNSWSLNISGHLKAHDFKLSVYLRTLAYNQASLFEGDGLWWIQICSTCF